MTTKELSQITGVPPKIIKRHAREFDGIPVAGRTGYVFPKDSPKWLFAILRESGRGGI